MGNSSDKQPNKYQNALEIIKKMKVKEYKHFEQFFYKCNTDKIQQVSKPLRLQEKIKEYMNSQIISTLKQFEQKYCLYREVRGDGNCFYRSIFFLYIENLIVMKSSYPKEVETRIEFLREISSDLHKSVMPQTIPLELEKFFIHTSNFFKCGISIIQLDIIDNNNLSIIQKIQQLQIFLNKYPIFDFSSILLMRKLAGRGYQKFQRAMEFFYIGNERQVIEDYSIEGQNCIVKLISEYLCIPISIEYVQHNSVSTVSFTPEFTKKNNNNEFEFPTLYLFFRPGHYDICYSKEYCDKIYFRQETPIQTPIQKTTGTIIQKKQPNIISQEQKNSLMQNLQTNYGLNENCFFCKDKIYMLINEMRICERCYSQKIGSSIPSNECKICKKYLIDNKRQYCLCDDCESKYFDFTDTPTSKIQQVCLLLPSSSILYKQSNQNITVQVNNNQQQQQYNSNQLQQQQKYEEYHEQIVIGKEQYQEKITNKAIDNSFNENNNYTPPKPNIGNIFGLQKINLENNNNNNNNNNLNISQTTQLNNRRSATLLENNFNGIQDFYYEDKCQRFKSQIKQNYVRCVLCLNITDEFQNIKCLQHLVCIPCSENNSNLNALCFCSLKDSTTNTNQQIINTFS